MIKIIDREKEGVEFQSLKQGETFSHNIGSSVYMKKEHVDSRGQEWQSIDVTNGVSYRTSPDALCKVVTLNATIFH